MNVSRKKYCLAVLFMIAALLFTACNGTDLQTQKTNMPPEDENLIVIGVSQLGSESMWRTANTNSLRETFSRDNGYFLLFDNARQKQENQIKAIRSFISQRVDYIVFSPIVEDGWDTVLEEAKEAGIPVIIMDRNVNVDDDSLYTAWIGSNFEKEGEDAGRWLEDELRGKKFSDDQVNIVVLQGTANSTAMIGRTEGFNKIAAEHDNWNILACEDADFTTAKGKEVMQEYIDRYADIDVIVSQNDDMTFGALETLSENGMTTGTGGDITLISFDGTKTALEKVKSGVINVDVECNPILAPDIESIISKLENGQSVDKINYVEEKVFTQKNVLSVLDDRKY